MDQAARPSSVRLTRPTLPPAKADDRCPRCGGVLKFPELIGACTKCGYCRADPGLSTPAPQSTAASARVPNNSETVEVFNWARCLPVWFWSLTFVTILLVGASVAANYLLPADSIRRTIISTFALPIGIVGLLFAQVWILIQLIGEDGRLGLYDAINPLHAWNLGLKNLPTTRRPTCLGVWSLTIIICVFSLVGGLWYWVPDKHYPKNRSKGFLQAIEDWCAGRAEGEEPPDEPDEPAPKEKPKPDSDLRPTIACVIVAYLPNDEGGLDGIVLARAEGDHLRYAGIVEKGLSGWKGRNVRNKLSRQVTPKPSLEGLDIQAIWVKPVLSCNIHQSGVSALGLLIEPAFQELLEEEKKK
jgi:hypothetical protein